MKDSGVHVVLIKGIEAKNRAGCRANLNYCTALFSGIFTFVTRTANCCAPSNTIGLRFFNSGIFHRLFTFV